MILTKGKKKAILGMVEEYKEKGLSKKEIIIDLCMEAGFPVDFAMEIFEKVKDIPNE